MFIYVILYSYSPSCFIKMYRWYVYRTALLISVTQVWVQWYSYERGYLEIVMELLIELDNTN